MTARLQHMNAKEPPLDPSALPVPGYMCATDWLGQPPVIDPADIVATYDAEVVVVGSGHSGTQCALSAAEGGAKVMVLEMMREDKYFAKGGDIATFNSKHLTSQGYGNYDLGEITAEYIRRAGQAANFDVIASYVQNSGEALDHIVSIIPETSNLWSFEEGQTQVQVAYGDPDPSQYPVELGGYKMWAACLEGVPGTNAQPVCGRENVSRMTEMELYCREEAKKHGAEWFYGTKGVVLVQNDNGDVTGVIGQNDDGYVQFNASKAVVLTTGDFSGNAEMVVNLIDIINEMDLRNGMDLTTITGWSGLDGTGHKMGCWAGGAIESHPRCSLATIMMHPGPWGSTPFLMLNSKGKRFMNEANGPFARIAMMHQPHGVVSVVTDANYFESIKVAGCDHGAPVFGKVSDEIGLISTMIADMEAAIGSGPEGYPVQTTTNVMMGDKATVYCGQTLEELLGYMGYEGAALEQALASIEQYNELCHKGHDDAFGKDPKAMVPIEQPPFYGACRMEDGTGNVSLVTLCGLVTDEHMNVLQMDGTTPIKGLYCAGNVLGGRFGSGYNAPVAGSGIGMAVTHGYVLGKHLAEME